MRNSACLSHLPQMPEEEAFCVFVRLMQEYRLRELFKPSMAELGLCIYQFEYLLQVKRTQEAVNKALAMRNMSTEGQQLIQLWTVYFTDLGFNNCAFSSHVRSNFQS